MKKNSVLGFFFKAKKLKVILISCQTCKYIQVFYIFFFRLTQNSTESPQELRFSDHLTKTAQNQPENTTVQGQYQWYKAKKSVLRDASVRIKLTEQWQTVQKNQTTCHETASLLKDVFIITTLYFNYKFIKITGKSLFLYLLNIRNCRGL